MPSLTRSQKARIQKNARGSKKVTATQRNQVKKMVRKCMNHLKKKCYELDLKKSNVDMAVLLTSVVDKPSSSNATYAGKNIIQINLNYWQIWYANQSKDGYRFKEYDAFNNHPTIGGIDVRSGEDVLWLMVAHEVAHHVQYLKGPWITRYQKNYRKPHGDCFKAIYDYLRRDLINPMIKEQ